MMSNKVKAVRFLMPFLGLLLVLVHVEGFCRAGTAFCAQGDEPTVRFRWAFGALVKDGDSRRLEPVAQDRILKTGDAVKMMVEPHSKCYVYLVHLDSRNELKLLFPYSPDQFTSDYHEGRKYYIPQGGAWFELDAHTGTEIFHLVASVDRLVELEEWIRGYQAAGADEKPGIAGKISEYIRNLRRQQRELAAPAERPVAIGGAVRGMEKHQESGYPDVAIIATDILSTGFIARTFTIDHQ